MGNTNSWFHLSSMLISKDETKLSPEAPYTREVNCHVPSRFCTYPTFVYGKVNHPLKLYWGKDCVEVFCDHIEEEAKELYHMFPPKLMEPLMPEQWEEFVRVRENHICQEHFEPWDEKVRDHCHYNGKYREATHQKCNLWYSISCYVPVIFHDLSGYDTHLFIRELGKKFNSGSIGVITDNKEKHISFNIEVFIEEHEMPLGEIKPVKKQL